MTNVTNRSLAVRVIDSACLIGLGIATGLE